MLSACGGGSGGSSTPVASVPTPVPDSLNATVPELPEFGESSEYIIDWSVDYIGKSNLTYTVDSTSPYIQVEANDSALAITTDELFDIDDTVSFSVTISDGTLSEIVDISAPLINTSLVNDIQRIEAASKKAKLYLESGAQELLTVNAYLIEQAYMLGNINLAEKDDLMDGVTALSQEYLGEFPNGIIDLVNTLDKFNNQALSDSEASWVLENWELILNSSVAKISDLNSFYNPYDMYGIAIPTITTIIETDVYSLFQGNEALGSFTVDDKWEYAQAYNYLNLLIGNSTMTCPVEG